jgi:hypothetical protein
MDHIKTLRLFDLARAETSDSPFCVEEWEEEHLFQCVECQDKLEMFLDHCCPVKCRIEPVG